MADQPSLTVLGGPLGGRRFAFEDGSESVLIGSDPSCTFRLELPGVSPIHARVRMEDGTILVYDTQSPRGLFVNDDRVTSQMPLRNGDVLWLGTPGEPGVVMIQCRVPPSATAATSSAASGNEATQAVSPEEAAMYAEPIVEPEPTMAEAPEPEEAEATLIQSAPVEGADSFFGEGETQAMPAPTSAPASWAAPSDDQLPTSFSVESPTMRAPAPTPLRFEDEDQGESAEPTVMMPPPVEPPAPEPPAPPPPAAAPPSRPATPTPPRTAPKPGPPSMRLDPQRKPGPPSMPPRSAAGTAPRRPAKAGGGGGKGAMIAIGGLVAALAIAGAVYLFVLKPKPGAQTTDATPTEAAATEAPAVAPTASAATRAPTAAPTEASPTPVEVVTMVSPPTAATTEPTAAPTTATPRAATPRAAATKPAALPTQAPATPNPAALAAAAKGQGDRALAAGQLDAAVGHYDEALRLSPGDAEAAAGRAKAIAGRDAARRRFVPGVTSVKSAKQGKADLTGFESADVKVAGALEYSGRIDFEVKPERVKGGDSYSVRVVLTNDGKKELKIATVNVYYVANGNKSGGPVSARVKQVAPQANVLLDEFPGVWNEGTTSWSMEVVVASNRGDTFRNQLTWK